jgi:hypothetical protein
MPVRWCRPREQDQRVRLLPIIGVPGSERGANGLAPSPPSARRTARTKPRTATARGSASGRVSIRSRCRAIYSANWPNCEIRGLPTFSRNRAPHAFRNRPPIAVCALWGEREITTITLHPCLFPLLHSAFVAGVTSLGKEPMVLPDAYHACTRAFAAAAAAAAAAATPGSPLVLILEDDAALARQLGNLRRRHDRER